MADPTPTPPTLKVRDALERLWWTFVAAFLTTLLASPALLALVQALSSTAVTVDVSPVGYAVLAAALAGLIAVGNALLIIARWRLAVLPNPGAGLPQLPTRG